MEIKAGQLWLCNYGSNREDAFKSKHYIKGIRLIKPSHCGKENCEECNNKKPYNLVDIYNGTTDQYFEIEKYLKMSQYIGDSQVSIEDLFKVKE